MAKGKNTILIADGSLYYRDTLAMFLTEDLEMEVISARDAKEMLLLVKKAEPDVIIYDLYSVSDDFPQTMKNVKSLNPNTKVIVISYDTQTAIVEYCFNNAASAFISKSIADVTEFAAAIKKVLSGENVVLTSNTKATAAA